MLPLSASERRPVRLVLLSLATTALLVSQAHAQPTNPGQPVGPGTPRSTLEESTSPRSLLGSSRLAPPEDTYSGGAARGSVTSSRLPGGIQDTTNPGSEVGPGTRSPGAPRPSTR